MTPTLAASLACNYDTTFPSTSRCNRWLTSISSWTLLWFAGTWGPGDSAVEVRFLDCRTQISNSLCHCVWALCALDIIVPVETTRNYGLHGYCGKITNCRLLRRKLSRMSSRAPCLEPDLPSSTGTHTSFAVINTRAHTHAHTLLFSFSHAHKKKKKICSQTTVIKLVSRLIDTPGATLRNTNSRTPGSTHSPALVRSLISSHGRVTAAALRERLCGCSHVYVWEISNDERMPFQVWARGASVQCSTLLTTHTHIHTHTHTLCASVCAYIACTLAEACVISSSIPSTLFFYSHHMLNTSQRFARLRNHCLQIHGWHWFGPLSGVFGISVVLVRLQKPPRHLTLVSPSSLKLQWKSLIVLLCLYVVSRSFLWFSSSRSLLQPFALALFSVFFISSPCGVVDYNVTFINFPMPGDEPSALDLPCHYLSLQKPNRWSYEV